MPTQQDRLPFEVWALVAGGFTVALGYGVVAPAIPQFALEFGVSNFAASAIVSAFALMRLVGAPFAGWVVNRLGERRTYSIGILVVAVSTGAAALAMNYTQFVILRGLGGIGSAMFTIAATALLIKVSPVKSRGRVASVNAAGFLLGGLLGPVLGGIVASFGIRAPFVFYFITLVIAATVVAIALRRSAIAAAAPSASQATMSLREALMQGRYRALVLSMFSFGWVSFGVRISIVPILVAVVFQGDAATAAWILAAYALGNAIFILPSGRWSDTWGRKPMLLTGTLILIAAYVAIPIAPSLWWLAAVLLVGGIGSALMNPAHQAVLADVLEQRRGGPVVATTSMASDLGGVLGPLVAGALVDLAGFGVAFWATSGLLVAVLFAWLVVPESRRGETTGNVTIPAATDDQQRGDSST